MGTLIGIECPNFRCRAFVPVQVTGDNPTPFDVQKNSWKFVCPQCKERFSATPAELTVREESGSSAGS
jgi:hypothetical protein